MKRFTSLSIAVIAMSVLFIGCAQSSMGGEATPAMSSGEEIAAKVWSKLQSEDYRSTWKMWPGKAAFYKGQHPHGALLTTYVNDVAYDAIANKKGTLPAGSIIVKENYMPNKMLGAITVMKKMEGYNPEVGDWFWAKLAGDGKPMTMEKDGMTMTLAGKVGGCIGCHTSQAANDYLFTSPVK